MCEGEWCVWYEACVWGVCVGGVSVACVGVWCVCVWCVCGVWGGVVCLWLDVCVARMCRLFPARLCCVLTD